MNKRGLAFVFFGAVLWGTTGTSQALAPEGAGSLAIGALRLLVGGLALLGIMLARRSQARQGTSPRLPLGAVIGAAACMAAYQVLFFAGVARTGVAVGTIVGIGSSPILAGALGFLFRGERPGWRWAAATFLAVLGCALLLLAGAEIRLDGGGIALAIGAGAAYSTFSLVSKQMLDRHPVETVMAVVFSLGAVMLSPLLFTQRIDWAFTPRGAAVILHLGLLATALAYLLYGRGLALLPLSTAVTLSLAEPLTAGILGVALLGEKMTALSFAGVALIFSGLVVLAARRPAAAGSLEPTP